MHLGYLCVLSALKQHLQTRVWVRQTEVRLVTQVLNSLERSAGTAGFHQANPKLDVPLGAVTRPLEPGTSIHPGERFVNLLRPLAGDTCRAGAKRVPILNQNNKQPCISFSFVHLTSRLQDVSTSFFEFTNEQCIYYISTNFCMCGLKYRYVDTYMFYLHTWSMSYMEMSSCENEKC